MFATFTKLFAGSAFSAVLAVPQLASAGCGPSAGCPAPACTPAQAVTCHAPAAPATAVVAPAPANQPPVAQGPGRVVRRFSYEPGTEAVAQGVSAAPAYRSAAPLHRSPRPRSGGFNGNSAERRLNAGAGSHGYRR